MKRVAALWRLSIGFSPVIFFKQQGSDDGRRLMGNRSERVFVRKALSILIEVMMAMFGWRSPYRTNRDVEGREGDQEEPAGKSWGKLVYAYGMWMLENTCRGTTNLSRTVPRAYRLRCRIRDRFSIPQPKVQRLDGQ